MAETESLDAWLVRFRSRGRLEEAEPLHRALLEAQRFRDAAEIAEAEAEVAPSYAVFERLALARRADGDLVLAQRAWLECIRHDPAAETPYLEVIAGLVKRGDFERARKLLAKAESSCRASDELARVRAELGAGTPPVLVMPEAAAVTEPMAPAERVAPTEPVAGVPEVEPGAIPVPAPAAEPEPVVASLVEPERVVGPERLVEPELELEDLAATAAAATAAAPQPTLDLAAQAAPAPELVADPAPTSESVVDTPPVVPEGAVAVAVLEPSSGEPVSDTPKAPGAKVPGIPPHLMPALSAAGDAPTVVAPRPSSPASRSVEEPPATPPAPTASPIAAVKIVKVMAVAPGRQGPVVPVMPPVVETRPPTPREADVEVPGAPVETSATATSPGAHAAPPRVVPPPPSFQTAAAPPSVLPMFQAPPPREPVSLPTPAIAPASPTPAPTPTPTPTPIQAAPTRPSLPALQAAPTRPVIQAVEDDFDDSITVVRNIDDDVRAVLGVPAPTPAPAPDSPAPPGPAGSRTTSGEPVETIRVSAALTEPAPTAARTSKPSSAVPKVTPAASPRPTPAPAVAPPAPPGLPASPAAAPTVTSAPEDDVRSPQPGAKARPKSSNRWLVAGAVVVAAGAGLAAWRSTTTARKAAEWRRLEASLGEASSAAYEAAARDATRVADLALRAQRDLELEALLLESVQLGGVSDEALAGARVRARARGVSEELLAVTDTQLAALRSGATPAAAALPARTAMTTARVASAAQHDRGGDCAAAARSLDGLSTPAALWVRVELERCAGDLVAAKTHIIGIRSNTIRVRVARASLALDAHESVDLAAVSLPGDASAAEKAYHAAMSARALAAAGDAVAASARLADAPGVSAAAPVLELELAAAELAVGRASDAVERLRGTFGPSPSHARARRVLAEALVASGRGREALALMGSDVTDLRLRAQAALHASPDEARGVADEIAAQTPSVDVALRALELRLRVVAGEAPFALIERATAVRNEHPESREAWIAMASVAAAAERWELLAAAVPPVLAEDREVVTWLAHAAIRRGALEEVRPHLERLEATASDASDTVFVRAWTQLEQGEFDAALASYENLVNRDDVVLEGASRAVGVAGKLEVLLALGRLDEARALDRELAAVAPTPTGRRARARLAILEGRAAEVLPDFEARALDPSDSPAFLALFADALFATGAVDRASEMYRDAVELDGSLPEAHLGIAAVLLRAERFREAATELVRCRRALDGRPRGPAAEGRYFTLLGRALLGERDVAEARFALRRAIQKPGVPIEAHFFLGEALAGENAPDAAAAYRRYLELAPEGQFAERARRAIR